MRVSSFQYTEGVGREVLILGLGRIGTDRHSLGGVGSLPSGTPVRV